MRSNDAGEGGLSLDLGPYQNVICEMSKFSMLCHDGVKRGLLFELVNYAQRLSADPKNREPIVSSEVCLFS